MLGDAPQETAVARIALRGLHLVCRRRLRDRRTGGCRGGRAGRIGGMQAGVQGAADRGHEQPSPAAPSDARVGFEAGGDMRSPWVRWHHCAMRSTGQSKNSRTRASSRRSRVLGLALLVAAAHAAVLLLATRPAASVAVRALAVEVRTLTLPSPVAIAQTVEPSGRATPSSAGTPHQTRRDSRRRARQRWHAQPAVPAPASPWRPCRRAWHWRRRACRHRSNCCSRCSAAPTADTRACRGRPTATATRCLLQATLPSGREIEQMSQGGFDAAGIAPGAPGRSQARARRACRQLPTRAWQGHVLGAALGVASGNRHARPAELAGATGGPGPWHP